MPHITLSYLRNARPDSLSYSSEPPPVPPNRRPVGRLSWIDGCVPDNCSDDMFAEAVEASVLPNSQFYLDTSFITGREVSERLWSALLRKHIVIVPPILDELGPWLNDPFCNRRFRDILVESMRVGHPGIRMESMNEPAYNLPFAESYYTHLLSARRRVHDVVKRALERSLGRVPTDSELDRAVSTLVQDRGKRLAIKGQRESHKKGILADEWLLVRSAVSSIVTGVETYVLTRDSVYIEQFYKLFYLIDTHYTSGLVASLLAEQPLNFAPIPLERQPHVLESLYRSSELFHVPGRALDVALPADHHFVVSSVV